MRLNRDVVPRVEAVDEIRCQLGQGVTADIGNPSIKPLQVWPYFGVAVLTQRTRVTARPSGSLTLW